MTRLSVFLLALFLVVPNVRAQSSELDSKAAISVADSVLMALSTGDNKALARLSLDSAAIGGVGLRNRVESLSLQGWGA